MKDNLFTDVFREMVNIVDGTVSEISDMFKGQNPVDQQQVPMDEQIVQYKTMDSQQAQDMIKQYGPDEVERWMEKVADAIKRRGLND